MAYEYTIDPGENLIRMRCSGDFFAGDFFEHTEQVNRDPLFRPGMDTLCDYTRARFGDDVSSIMDFVDRTTSLFEARGKCRWAVIASGSDFAHLIKVFDMVTEKRGAGIEIRAFQSEGDAMDWLASGRGMP